MAQHLITAIIADDESHARERLRQLLEKFDFIDIVSEASDGNEALSHIVTHKPDVAFLDINMPGISVFTSMPSLQKSPLIVFQTAYSEYASDAFEIDAVDYLLKPIRPERLEKAVEKIRRRLNPINPQHNDSAGSTAGGVSHITIRAGDTSRVVAVQDIVRISSVDGFCYLFTADEKLMSERYLNFFEEKLAKDRFYRTSRTDIVNLDCIKVIQKEYHGMHSIMLKNGARVDLSRRRARGLRKLIDF